MTIKYFKVQPAVSTEPYFIKYLTASEIHSSLANKLQQGIYQATRIYPPVKA
jgi:hypothetical protein